MPTIAIVGGGFSGTITAVHLLRRGPGAGGRLVLVNRSGAMARGVAYGTHSDHHVLNVPSPSATTRRSPVGPPPAIVDARATVRAYLRALRQAAREGMGDGGDWRDVVASIRPLTPRLWQVLPPDERRRFMRHAAADVELDVGTVVNCTGPAGDTRRLDDPLFAHLRAEGLLRTDPLGLGIDTSDSGALLGRDGHPSATRYYVGPFLRARAWEATAVPELCRYARRLADRLVDDVGRSR